MLLMASPPATVEVVAQLSTATSHCEIRKRVIDEEAGEPLEVKCGSATRSLGKALKGVSVDRISACRVFLTLNAVHFPHLLHVDNCHGRLVVSDVGSAWIKQLLIRARIKPQSVEFVSYERVDKRVGCYNVTVTYDANARISNTAYRQGKGTYCD